MSWRDEGQGPKWVPILNAVEDVFGIPKDLLARVAYEESHFREDIISGLTKSKPGALGLMQMLPKYWTSVDAPIPFSEIATTDQIHQAAKFLVSLYHRFGTWAAALAAYNFGPGNEEKFLEHRIDQLPEETQRYVREILADVPVEPIGRSIA